MKIEIEDLPERIRVNLESGIKYDLCKDDNWGAILVQIFEDLNHEVTYEEIY